LTTSASKRLAPYTHLLSTKEKYKPVAKKVRPVIGELLKKFRIEHKIIGNPLNDLPVLNPNPPPFIHTDRYTSSDKISSTKTTLATSCGQQRETLCTTSC
jgi:hypothetical protein